MPLESLESFSLLTICPCHSFSQIRIWMAREMTLPRVARVGMEAPADCAEFLTLVPFVSFIPTLLLDSGSGTKNGIGSGIRFYFEVLASSRVGGLFGIRF